MDLAGPLSQTVPRGYTYGMVAVEHFTKHLGIIPLYSKEPEVVSRFSAPAEVVTDRGGEFQGAFEQLLQQRFVDHRCTSAGHPQADGLAERMVQVVKAAICKHSMESGSSDKWDEYLPWLALAYRCSPQASTRYSPYELMSGVPPVVPPALRERMAEPLGPVGANTAEGYAIALQERALLLLLRKIVPAAAANLLAAQHRDSQRCPRALGEIQAPSARLHPRRLRVRAQSAVNNTLEMPVHDEVLRVERVGPLGMVVLIGRDGVRLRRRIEQLVPCHLPDIDPIVDPRAQRPPSDYPYEVCGSPDDGPRMLLCDACGTGSHMRCLVPQLSAVPSGQWVCPKGREKESVEYWGELVFRGTLERPRYFWLKWDGGAAESSSLVEAKKMLAATEALRIPKRG
ncbi:hypothetical protein GPECTOR_3g510 [Gonium pectorale]|uniref:Integrase catalytic domain-containing protein n=1 Tax=Gonium pectorale TaxID=33097 RepID=A0A150H029_GONPE|nr:hypothetical protein GPECTOR_3g510 [Gonium pectorale]|eukprot:KXZ55384.1 hypothetical protein GPECTOR_3g510 [Gonium pectorale]